MVKEYLKVPSTDKINTLNVKIYRPEGEAKGIFQVVHGMTEHLERYDEILSLMCENGYFCIIHDHLGHGKTAKDGDLGYIAEKNGYKILIDDVHAVYTEAAKLCPDKKRFLMGHSMGSFITRLYVAKYKDNVDGYVMMGSGAGNPAANIGLFLTRFLAKVRGNRHVSKFIYAMAFGSYNKKFKERSRYAWLSRDMEITNKYKKDQYCTFLFTVSAMNDLIRLNKECNRKKWYESLPEKANILIMSGDMDPVGGYGKGITKVYNRLLSQNKYCVELKLYNEARHEILNDYCKNEVRQDILNFCNNFTEII